MILYCWVIKLNKFDKFFLKLNTRLDKFPMKTRVISCIVLFICGIAFYYFALCSANMTQTRWTRLALSAIFIFTFLHLFSNCSKIRIDIVMSGSAHTVAPVYLLILTIKYWPYPYNLDTTNIFLEIWLAIILCVSLYRLINSFVYLFNLALGWVETLFKQWFNKTDDKHSSYVEKAIALLVSLAGLVGSIITIITTILATK